MHLNHIHLNAPSVADMQAFYERYFGFKKTFDHGEGVFMEDEAGFLLAIDPLPPGEEPNFPSWFHLGFCLDDPKRVRELYEALSAGGAGFSRELREFGEDAVNFYCVDPAGYKIEVSWHRAD